MKTIVTAIVGLGAAAALAGWAAPAAAQDWPKQRPVQFVVAFGPGSSTDIVGRLMAQKLTEGLGPDVREKLGQLGFESRRNTPAEFAAFVREEIPKWAKAVKDSGAKVD